MKLSRESEHALQALSILARQPRGEVMPLREIAETGSLPPGVLARTFQQLKRQGIVASHRGTTRGYALARPADEITLREIFQAIEGPDLFERCIFSGRPCVKRSLRGAQCQVHETWMRWRSKAEELMHNTTLAEVAAAESWTTSTDLRRTHAV